MNTKYIQTRIIIIAIIYCLLMSSCGQYNAQATRDAVMSVGEEAATRLVGGMTPEEAAIPLVAINAVRTGVEGAYMVLNDVQHVAIFVAKGAAAPGGGNYTFLAAVNTNNSSLMNANQVLSGLGIDFGRVRTFEELKQVLSYRGFKELAPTSVPVLYQTIRLGLAYLSTVGNALTEVIIVPVYMLTNPLLLDNSYGGEMILQ